MESAVGSIGFWVLPFPFRSLANELVNGDMRISMKKNHLHIAFLFVLLLGISGLGMAQTKVYIGAGFNQSFTNVDSLSWIIDRYNENANPDKELGSINSPRGLAFSAGIAFNRFLFDISYTGRGQTRKSAEAPVGNNTFYYERHLRFRANTIDIGVGLILFENDFVNLALGTSIDFGSVKVFTRYGRNDQVNSLPLQSPIVNELTLGNTYFLQGMYYFSHEKTGFALIVRPYFQLDLFRNDYAAVNRNFNPSTYQSDPLFILSNSHNFGVKVILAYSSR